MILYVMCHLCCYLFMFLSGISPLYHESLFMYVCKWRTRDHPHELNLQTSSLTSFYFGIINQVPSMIYPLSIHPLYSILRLFPSLGRTSVFMSNMALNHRSIRAWSYSVLETKTFINSGFGPNRHFSPLAHT